MFDKETRCRERKKETDNRYCNAYEAISLMMYLELRELSMD